MLLTALLIFPVMHAIAQGDLLMIKFTYKNDFFYGLYQLLLIGLSFLIVWMLVGMYNIILPFEFYYYFIIIFVYVVLKYNFILLRIIVNKIRFYKGIPHSAAGYRRLVRRGYKPKRTYFYEGV